MHRLQDLIRLHRQGEGSRVIARQLRMGRETIRAYLRVLKEAELLDGSADALPELEVLQRALAARLPPRPAAQQQSSLEDWREMIEAMHGRRAGAKAIFDADTGERLSPINEAAARRVAASDFVGEGEITHIALLRAPPRPRTAVATGCLTESLTLESPAFAKMKGRALSYREIAARVPFRCV